MRRYWYIPAALLLVLLIVGFLAGWLQLSLGPDTWGVVVLRSGSVEPAVVSPSGFSWRLRRLLPGAMSMHRFTLAIQRTDRIVSTVLPSADVYSSLAAVNADFSLEIRLSIRYRIRPEALPSLVDSGGLRPMNLADWYQSVNAELERQARDIALEASRSAVSDSAALAGAISSGLPDRFPYLELLTVTPTVVRAPDLELYRTLREASLRLIAAKEQSLKSLAPQLAAEETAQRAALQRHEASITILTKYGELLSKYPALIKFLFLTTTQKVAAKDLAGMDILNALKALDALD
jgi:hypothetical protein